MKPTATPTPPAPTATATPAPRPIPGSADRLLVRAGTGAPYIAGLDIASGRTAFTIPAGLPTTDWSRWVILTPATGTTTVELYRAWDGRKAGAFSVPGQYQEGAISHNDRWLLLVQPPSAGASTPVSHLALVELATGKVVESARLAGRYLADTVDDAGRAIFLIEQHPERKANAYQVVLYDVASHKVTGPIVDKRSSTGIMSGSKVRHGWSKSGDWLLSLYLDPGGDGAFIHSLNVSQRFAWCVDLPCGSQPAAILDQYGLAMSGSDHVYAVNPALQMVSIFTAGDGDARPFPLTMPPATTGPGYSAGTRPYNASLVSPDGATLYAGTAQGILRQPTASMAEPASVLLPGKPVVSLGMGPSGGLLYALLDGAPRRLLALDPASGSVLGDLSSLVAQPAGIEQVAQA